MAEVFYKAIAFVKTTMKAADSWKVSSQSCVLYIGFKIIRNLKSITNVQTKCQGEYIKKTIYSQFQTERGSYGDAIKYDTLRASVKLIFLSNAY